MGLKRWGVAVAALSLLTATGVGVEVAEAGHPSALASSPASAPAVPQPVVIPTPTPPAAQTAPSAASVSPAVVPPSAAAAPTASTGAAPTATPAPATTPAPAPSPAGPGVDCTAEKCIALTFDDGPNTPTTSIVLDALKAHGAHATFFVGWRLKENCAVARRALAEGNTIGNHTWSHKDLTSVTTDEANLQLSLVDSALGDCGIGAPTTLLRPPFGAFRAGIPTGDRAVIMWSIDPQDWKDRDTTLVTQRVLSAARPGAIILLHDIHPTSANAVAGILDGLQAQGYRVVTVDTLLAGNLRAGSVYTGR